MLIDQAKELTSRIGEYTRLKNNALATKDFETRASSFARVADSLRSTKSIFDRLQASEIFPAFEPKDAEGLALKATSLRDLLKDDPAILNDPPFNLKYDFVDRINGWCGAASKAALAAWQQRVSYSSEMASDEVLAALGAVPQYKPVIARIATLKQKVAALKSSIPADVSAGLAELDSIMSSYTEAWNEMTGEGISSSVVAFLRAAAGQGAPLCHLTEEVESWLEARGLLALFRIKI